jgi:hypothetical protein
MEVQRRKYQVQRATWVSQVALGSLIISLARSTKAELVPAKALEAQIPIILSALLMAL